MVQTIALAIDSFDKEALLSLIMAVVDEHKNGNGQQLLAVREMEGHFTLGLWSKLHKHTRRNHHLTKIHYRRSENFRG